MNQEELEKRFDEMLDDCYEPITMGFGTYYASDILKSCDPIAYRLGVSEYEDYEEEGTL